MMYYEQPLFKKTTAYSHVGDFKMCILGRAHNYVAPNSSHNMTVDSLYRPTFTVQSTAGHIRNEGRHIQTSL